MARNEQIICDVCGETWNRLNNNGDCVSRHHKVNVLWSLVAAVGVENDTKDALEAEICGVCRSLLEQELDRIKSFLSGNRAALGGPPLRITGCTFLGDKETSTIAVAVEEEWR